MKSCVIATACVLSMVTAVHANPWWSSSSFSQTDFNSLDERIGGVVNPWTPFGREGAIILGDGSVGTGPIDSEVQFGRLIGFANPLIFLSGSDGVVRKELFGKRIMRVGGKEFVDKGFGWKQTYGPGAGMGVLGGGDPFGLPSDQEDDLIEDAWRGNKDAIDDLTTPPTISLPQYGSNNDGGYPGQIYVQPEGNPQILSDELTDFLKHYGQFAQTGQLPNGEVPSPADGDKKKTPLEEALDEKAPRSDAPLYAPGGDLGLTIEKEDANQGRFFVGLRYEF